MSTPSPLPASVAFPDVPVVRRRAYLAFCVHAEGHLTPRWHVWHASGAYVGYCTEPALIDLTIAQHQPPGGTA
ncbi:hypothetical protein ABT160_25915 [Streptomyces sp. NPDC001941]|uniref:hypothetical protein n=1 Tax=Streptomyces sp. NPDC001941 TaxID=3154659 RepID=UPI0033283BB5